MGVLTIERLDATLGARITGVRLADLDDGTWEAIDAAFDEHAVLVFPGRVWATRSRRRSAAASARSRTSPARRASRPSATPAPTARCGGPTTR